MAIHAPITGASDDASPHKPERLPLSQLALVSWQQGMAPDDLDTMAELFRTAAAEMRAAGLGKVVLHA